MVYEADELALKAGLRPRFDWDDNGDGSNACVVAHRRFTETDLERAHATFDCTWREKYPLETISDLIVCAIDADL